MTHSSTGHHPGPPRFLQVGDRITDPIFVDGDHVIDRDNLAPTIDGEPSLEPESYDAEDFQWSVRERPAGSTAEVAFALPAAGGEPARYDHGRHNTAEFEPDRAGTYVLELNAPDGTHELTIIAFPAPDREPVVGEGVGGATAGQRPVGGPPRIDLEGRYDAESETFVIDANAELAPDSRMASAALEVAFRPHDASALDPDAVAVEGTTAHVPRSALEKPTRLFAAPFDGDRVGVTDELLLEPATESVSDPNRPPEWLDDAVIYEIFTRSFAGEPGRTDFESLSNRVPYLASLGIDVLWLTPINPAWSPTVDAPPGGPHGYSITDYVAVAEDLGTLAAFEAFVEQCHDHGIKVCFDLVVNHCGYPNRLFQETIERRGPKPADPHQFPAVEAWDEEAPTFDWFDRQVGASETDAAPAQTSFFDVRLQPNLNYGNLALREYVLAVVEFWAARVDMLRCDIAWGVPHSFWTEVRDRVRAIDPEIALLDETVPKRPAFAASEFDCHFDTDGFTRAVHAVARQAQPASAILEAIESRQTDGFPRKARLLNAIENHDESRLFHEAETASHPDPAAAQRAATAAAFTLPGVPLVYYGQERLISRYGRRRTPAYADRDDRSDDLERDPYKRAFVNWTIYPPDHLAFYRTLIDAYHGSAVLGPTAALVRLPALEAQTPDGVLAFGREAGGEKRVVLVNFASDPVAVTLPDIVGTVDELTGTDVGRVGGDHSVLVETVAVLETTRFPGS